MISTYLNNPKNEKPGDVSKGDKPYGMEIAKNFPVSLRIFAIIFFIMMIISVVIMPGFP